MWTVFDISSHTDIVYFSTYFYRTGNLADIAKAGTVHNFLVDLHDEYGDLASFWWGNQITISIASPELFKETRAMFDRPGKRLRQLIFV